MQAFSTSLAMIGAGFCNTGQIRSCPGRMGEGRQDETLRILATGLRVAIVVGTLLILLVALGLNSGFSSVFRDANTAAVFHDFMGIRKWGYLPLLPRDDAQCLLHGDRPIRILMWAMIATGTVNVLGDALLIGGVGPFPALEAKGAAWASLTAESTGLLVLLGHAVHHHGRAVWVSSLLTLDRLKAGFLGRR